MDKIFKSAIRRRKRRKTDGSVDTTASIEIDTTTRHSGYSRDVIIHILEQYKNQEKLWNPSHPEFKYNAPRKVFDELCEPLNRDLGVALSGIEIFRIINRLKNGYRHELNKRKANQENAVAKSKLWYFEKMSFLRNIIEAKRAEKEAKMQRSLSERTDNELVLGMSPNGLHEKPNSRSLRNKEMLLSLIEAFQRKECLWNTKLSAYQDCNRFEKYEQISVQLLEEKNIQLTATECTIEIEKLVSRYRKELQMVTRRKGLHIPTLWCFDQLEFLREHVEQQLESNKKQKSGIIDNNTKPKFLKAHQLRFNSFEDQLKFIGIYQNFPCLWNVEHQDFRSVKYRNQALSEMLEAYKSAFGNDNVTVEQMERTIFELRKNFSAEKQKFLKAIVDNKTLEFQKTAFYERLSGFLESNIGPFRCDICCMLIKTSDQYKMHKSAHDGSSPFICVLCGKGFQIPGNLAIHIRRHKRDLPYSCEQCCKSFATSTEAAIHQRTHSGVRPYICDCCGKSFKTWSFFDIHRRMHLKQSTFLCPICDKGFYEKNRFTDHMNGHLNIRKHTCQVCEKSFTTLANLKKHSELHLPVKKYKCDDCERRFAQFASLRWHKRKMHSPNTNCDED